MIDIYVYINMWNIYSDLESDGLRERISDLDSEEADDDTKT